jgi:hypothetical protein
MDDREQPTAERWAICIRNDGYLASLERLKVYEVLPDADAERLDHIRVIDESGEDYLFPRSIFLEIEVPAADAEVIRRAS